MLINYGSKHAWEHLLERDWGLGENFLLNLSNAFLT